MPIKGSLKDINPEHIEHIVYCLKKLDMDYSKNPKTKHFISGYADTWAYVLTDAIKAAQLLKSIADMEE